MWTVLRDALGRSAYRSSKGTTLTSQRWPGFAVRDDFWSCDMAALNLGRSALSTSFCSWEMVLLSDLFMRHAYNEGDRSRHGSKFRHWESLGQYNYSYISDSVTIYDTQISSLPFPWPPSTAMAPSKLFPEFPLPLELLHEIIKPLPLTDLQTLSLASRLTWSQAIHFIFGHLRYTDDIPSKVRNIHQARKDVKEVIKSACLF